MHVVTIVIPMKYQRRVSFESLSYGGLVLHYASVHRHWLEYLMVIPLEVGKIGSQY